MSFTSNRTGADTAAPAETHGVTDLAETTTVRSAGPDADTAAPDWDYGNGSLVAAPASGDASYGATIMVQSSQGRIWWGVRGGIAEGDQLPG